MTRTLIESYTLVADGVQGIVSIYQDDQENVALYDLVLPQIDVGTNAILQEVGEKLSRDVPVNVEEISDPTKIRALKELFYTRALEGLKEKFSPLPEEKLKVLAGVLLHTMYGLGDIEIFLADDFLEEIAINNSVYPITVFHKKHGWLKCTRKLDDEESIYNFASQIGRKVGRQISALDPIMDAHLLTGDRVAATLFPVSTLGNTITIRKFARSPWTIVSLIQNRTTSKEIVAFLWLAIQYENSILVTGGTASGKCVHGDSELYLSTGKVRIGDFVESLLLQSPMQNIEDGYVVDCQVEIDSFNPKTMKFEKQIATKAWKRRAPDHLYKIKTRSGRSILVTPEHPFFIPSQGGSFVRADTLQVSMPIAVPRKIDTKTFQEIVIPNGLFQVQESLSFSFELLWDPLISIEKVSSSTEWVYDLTVEGTHTFIANNIVVHNTSFLNALSIFIPPKQRIISIEDTREIELSAAQYWNWVPLSSRDKNPEGLGEVTMLDLMVASLRMRPDRIIVGEVRRKEQAETMFEAMHTGHSVYTTMHADTVEQIKRRLLEPPLSIPKAELEALQLIVVQHRDRRKNVRRTLEVAEILQGGKELALNYVFRWRARVDIFEQANKSSRLFEELNLHVGMTLDQIEQDLREKEMILQWMIDKDMKDIVQVGKMMELYYRDPQKVVSAAREKKNFSDLFA